MKFEDFKKAIREANEQFNIVQTEGVTEVHWIYAGFDLYEEVKRHPQYRSETNEQVSDIKRIFKRKEDLPEEDQPKYHVIATISEEREHVINLSLRASQIPERMRKTILPLIVEYTSTRLDERKSVEEPNKSEPVVKSAKELREEMKARKSNAQEVITIVDVEKNETKGPEKEPK